METFNTKTRRLTKNSRLAIFRKRPSSTSGSQGFDMLNEDVLLLIIDHIDAIGDITSLSRASHQFYRLAMRQLHRSIYLDLSLGPHRRLLRLLGKTPGRRPGLNQGLKIYGLDKASSSAALDLFLVFAKLKNLKSFSCDGSVIVPFCPPTICSWTGAGKLVKNGSICANLSRWCSVGRICTFGGVRPKCSCRQLLLQYRRGQGKPR
jgi:hypothetical protein